MRAIPEAEKVFAVRIGKRGQDLRFTPVELAAHYERVAAEIAEEMPSRYAHKRAEQWRAATAELEKARDVLAFFGLGTFRIDRKIEQRKAGEAAAVETLKAYAAKLIAQKEVRKRREMKERTARNIEQAEKYLAGGIEPLRYVDLASNAAALETLPADLRARFVAAVEAGNSRLRDEWRNGASVSLPYDLPVMLRAEGDEMVTSKGARVSLEDARRTYRFALLCRAKGWHRNGETHAIGAYQLDAVNENGVVAGCHRVTWEEIERFAALHGWAEASK